MFENENFELRAYLDFAGSETNTTSSEGRETPGTGSPVTIIPNSFCVVWNRFFPLSRSKISPRLSVTPSRVMAHNTYEFT
jgi:hypothetical protein